jgi:hypothetical protein
MPSTRRHGDPPARGKLYQEKVPAGIVVANGFGKFAGSTQVEELGEVETPILLTNTLSVLEAMAASIEWTLAQAGNAEVRTVNAVVGVTNDGGCDDGGVRQGTRAAWLQGKCRLPGLHRYRSEPAHRFAHAGAGCCNRHPTSCPS